MKLLTNIWCLLIFISLSAHSQLGEGTFLGQIDARSLSIGGSMVDFSFIDSSRLSFHHRRPFSLNALDRVGVEIQFPVKPMLVGTSFIQVGDDIVQEQSIQVHLKKATSRTIWIKVGCGLYRIHAFNGITGKSVYADLSILYLLNDALVAGCRLINPTGSTVSLNGEKKKLEQIYLIGLTYSPATSLDLVLEGEKRPGLTPLGRFGLLYSINQTFTVLGGFTAHPQQLSWGIKSTVGKMGITLGFGIHPQLGLTSAFSCSYFIRRNR